MSPDPLDPSSFNYRLVTVPSGRRFHVVDQAPDHWRGAVESAPTILMAHGWPDLWYGWRYQIAALSKRGYRVICPSQTGYGESSKPDDLEAYTFKSVAYDMNGVLDQLGAGKVVVFGHDWGGMVAWRFCEYFPDRVLAVASVCTPYMPPAPLSAPYTPLEKLVRTKVPQFGYQIFFSSPDSAAKFEVPGVLEYFLAGSFSATVKEAKIKAGKKTGAMPVKEGEFEKNLDRLRVRAEKGELGEMPNDPEYLYYLSTFRSTGLTHPLNWYRTRTLNFRDEQADCLAESGFPSTLPALLLTATEDPALPPSMAKSPAVRKAFEKAGNLRIEEIEGGDHWVLQDPRFRNAVTDRLEAFVQEVLSGKWKPEGAEAKL